MKYMMSLLISLVGWSLPAAASIPTLPPVPARAIPEPNSALLFAAGLAVALISIRMIRRR